MILDNNTLNNTSLEVLHILISEIEEKFKKSFSIKDEISVISYTGTIEESFEAPFMDFIEIVKSVKPNANILLIILTTPGGSAVSVERMVDTVRHNYSEVYFLIPDSAMSAGTIFCMSGDKIYMDYFSALGPIDPQVQSDNGDWVPALGYIDKLNELIDKSNKGTLTDAEFALLQKQDLGTIRTYEQARDLSISLLEKWLVEYKFKDWNTHKDKKEVTHEEKTARAKEIASTLSDNKRWHTHGRYINKTVLTEQLKLKIEDYSDKVGLRASIREYMKLLKDHIARINRRIFFHSDIRGVKKL